MDIAIKVSGPSAAVVIADSSPIPSSDLSASQMAAHTAYRLGIVHFRTLFAFTRLLPSYRLFRRLRRANNGLRIAMKVWAPEGYNNTAEDLALAWEVMERGLVPLDHSLDQFVLTESTSPDQLETHTVPPVDLFGSSYSLDVDYRSDVDFNVEDMESVLSEKFSDMDEDWFKPTVARHRTQDEARSTADARPSRRVSSATAIPATSPIPQRQQAAAPGSFGSLGTGSRPSTSRIISGTAGSAKVGSQGSGRWGVLAEGLPFAGPTGSSETRVSTKNAQEVDTKRPPSPSSAQAHTGVARTARRLSGHSVNMSSSPSTSLLRSTPPFAQNPQNIVQRPGSSVGRTSSFLSQSGRSFTHAQLANMSPPIGASPPVHSPHSPSSLSFTKQPIPRSLSSRAQYIPTSSTPPITSGSMEKESIASQSGSAGQGPQLLKRYSSSISRPSRLAGSHNSAEGVLAGPSCGPNINSQSLLRRTSTRASQESALRYSATPGADDDDIQAFLKTLDTLPQPPSLAAQAVQASRSHMPSTSSSLSNPSASATPSPLQASNNSPSSHAGHISGRTPLTRAQIDDQLRKMAGSFNVNTGKMVDSTSNAANASSRQPTPTSNSGSGSNAPSIGLLTASRPASTPRRTSLASSPPCPSYRRHPSYKTGSPLAAEPSHVPLPESPGPELRKAPSPRQPAARSLPGSGSTPFVDKDPLPARTTAPPTEIVSAQTTDNSTGTNESRASGRRGPVLLRGGFEGRTNKTNTSSSPSHSPIRDFAKLGPAPSRATPLPTRGDSTSLGHAYGRRTAGQRTAPSSFGVSDATEDGVGEDDEGIHRGRGASARRSEGGMSPRDEDRKESLRSGMMRDW